MSQRLNIRPGITARYGILPEQFGVHTLAGTAVLSRVREELPEVPSAARAFHWVWEIETSFYRGTLDASMQSIAIHYGATTFGAHWVTVEAALDGLEMLVADWVAKNPDLAERALGERRGVSYV